MKVDLIKEINAKEMLETATKEELGTFIQVLLNAMSNKINYNLDILTKKTGYSTDELLENTYKEDLKDSLQPYLDEVQNIITMAYETMEVIDSLNDEESN